MTRSARGAKPPRTLYLAYTDTAGSQSSPIAPVIVTAGIIGTKRRIDRLDAAWLRIFGDYGVSGLHMDEFVGSRGEYTEWKDREERRAAFLRELIGAAKLGINKAFIVYLQRAAFDSVDRRFELSESVQGHYAFAQSAALGRIISWAADRDPRGEIVTFIEKGDTGQPEFLKEAKRILGWRPELMTKRHPTSREAMTPIQLADLLAYQHRVAYEEHLGAGETAEFHPAFEEVRRMLPAEHVELNEPYLLSLCERSNVPRRKQG